MTAQDDPKYPRQTFLPKEPIDLPRPPAQAAGVAGRPKDPLDFPLPHVTHTAHTETQHVQRDQNPAKRDHDQPDKEQQAHPSHNPFQIETLLEWSAPGRPFRKRSKQYYLTSVLIMLLIEVILFLFTQYALMLVVLSLVFVAFALATVPPHDFKYRISSEGITIEDHFFLWQELYDFYFMKREGVDVIHIRTHSFIPGELTITLGSTDREHVKSVLLPYLPYREYIKPTFMEKSGDWLSRNFPLENTHH